MRRSFVRIAALALTTLALACQDVPKRYGRNVRPLPSSGLAEANPAEIAVAPIQDRAEGRVPEATLRQAFHSGLPRKRYSPLGLDYVDQRVVEASYVPGSSSEDAVLEIIVHRWDDDLWDLRSALDVDIEVRLVDARSQRPEPLWARRLDQRFDFGGKAESFVSDQVRLEFACEAIVMEVLSTLPPRETRPEPDARAGAASEG